MALVCNQCSRVNPSEAYYCFYDGAALAGRTSTGPINLGAQPFPGPFVFPSGLSCRNFDQLAMGCQQNWKEAVSVLKEGFLGGFFGTIGRVDLAMAAKDAASFPDENRGLDQLLEKLPSQVLEAPKLQVAPTEINLGQISAGVDRTIDLHLENLGMRLAYGTVSSDVPWLAVAGAPSKIFELTDELKLPIQVVGKQIRARLKPQEGHLIVESNAGNFILTIKMEVPPIAFTEGVLAGSLSPRQIAEKAKSNPTGAAPLFEGGAVAKWFAANGLTYPVQGPTAPGMAGVQQFFEALGLAKAPKVDFVVRPITIDGDPGKVFTVPLEVSTQEKKPVYAYATGDHPWIDGATAKPQGRVCTIELKITVPPRPGESIQAKVTVHGNGNQKFAIPLTVNVRGVKPAETAPTFEIEPSGEAAFSSFGSDSPFTLDESPSAPAGPADRSAFTVEPAATTTPPVSSPAAKTSEFRPGDDDIAFAPATAKLMRGQKRSGSWLHIAPAALLVLTVGGLVSRDFFAANVVDDIDPNPRVRLNIDYAAHRTKDISNTMMFGIEDVSEPGDKRLTSRRLGDYNSLVLKVDDRDRIFGKFEHGKIDSAFNRPGKNAKEFTFLFPDQRIAVEQYTSLLAGDPVQTKSGEFKRLYDTVLVRYKITNKDNREHKVGARFLLDTYIGMNDGTPFTIPGFPGLVTTVQDFHGGDVPDYIQAIENPNLQNPGTIAHLNLKLGGKYEAPNRVCLTRYPEDGKYQYDIPVTFDGEKKGKGGDRAGGVPIKDDSAVAIYWDEKPLAPGKSRELAFTYGIGSVAGQAELSILNPGPIVLNGEFSLVALLADAPKDAQATIELPSGLKLVDETKAIVTLAASTPDKAGKLQPSPATWRIRALEPGRHPITVISGSYRATRVVTVNRSSVF